MGLALEFVTGDVRRIVDALDSVDPDQLDDPAVVTGRADLSLHLIPKDLNLLSRAIGIHTGQRVIDLRPFLEAVADYPDRGALLVAPEWVRYVAAASADQVHVVTDKWFDLMRKEHDDPDLEVTADAVTAVTELVALCKHAQVADHQVIHLWFA